MTTPIKISEQHRDFFAMVFEVVKQIPEGRVTTYGAIARYLGMGRSSRLVGWAMNAAHCQQDYIPAHRVVNRAGILTGKHHFSTLTEMQSHLEKEGIPVVDDQIQNFERYLWDPAKELALD